MAFGRCSFVRQWEIDFVLLLYVEVATSVAPLQILHRYSMYVSDTEHLSRKWLWDGDGVPMQARGEKCAQLDASAEAFALSRSLSFLAARSRQSAFPNRIVRLLMAKIHL